ncbi:MAG: 30S ribosomal protein S17 [Candidatus Pacearchaeota archaeon]|nr:30S ribosomal protein S17 [Candidatus Pacearchaeota archaeon]
MKKKEKNTEKKEEKEPAEARIKDIDCPFHGNLKARGRIFEGKVIKKFPSRITIEFERMVRVRKYERYAKSKTKLHARLPICMEKEINVGDLIRIQECRPLSKIIHFVIISKVKSKEEQVKVEEKLK